MSKILLTLTLIVLCFRIDAQQPTTINFYLTPSLSEELLNKNGTFIKEYLEKETGLSLKMSIPASYDELIDLFGTQEYCFGMMNSMSYVVANQKHGVVAKLRVVRSHSSVYYGMIVANASLGIKKLEDLHGKSMVYTDELSTSGYLYPKKLLEKNKVKPSKETFAKKHDEVIRLVYEGKADAGAAFYSPPAADGTIRDARSRLKEKHPDIEKKVVIVVKTDPIPNDPIVFSKKFDPEIMRKLSMALIKLSTDPKGKQALLDIYGTEGFVKASDTDYNSLRQMMDAAR